MYYYIVRRAGLINIISQKFPSRSTTRKNVLYFHVCFLCVCVFICAVLTARAPTVQLSLIASVWPWKFTDPSGFHSPQSQEVLLAPALCLAVTWAEKRSYSTESYGGVSLPILWLSLTRKTFASWKRNVKCFLSLSEPLVALSLKWQCIAPRVLTQQEVGRMVAEITPSASLSVARSCVHPSRTVLVFHFIIHPVESETRTHGLESRIDTVVKCWGGRNSERLHETAKNNKKKKRERNERKKSASCFTCTDMHHTHLGPFTTEQYLQLLLTLWMATC